MKANTKNGREKKQHLVVEIPATISGKQFISASHFQLPVKEKQRLNKLYAIRQFNKSTYLRSLQDTSLHLSKVGANRDATGTQERFSVIVAHFQCLKM